MRPASRPPMRILIARPPTSAARSGIHATWTVISVTGMVASGKCRERGQVARGRRHPHRALAWPGIDLDHVHRTGQEVSSRHGSPSPSELVPAYRPPCYGGAALVPGRAGRPWRLPDSPRHAGGVCRRRHPSRPWPRLRYRAPPRRTRRCATRTAPRVTSRRTVGASRRFRRCLSGHGSPGSRLRMVRPAPGPQGWTRLPDPRGTDQPPIQRPSC